MVASDGSVFWSRPGLIKTLCPMHGLQNFPLDEIRCPLKFGGWVVAQNISFYTPAWSAEAAPNFSFQEFFSSLEVCGCVAAWTSTSAARTPSGPLWSTS
mmetsp:Transcript_28201/g.76295  ORF Transcript_28201/g.76295 Transcript_28201/m.76295 type:complete len:99 (-) Transcript_28201:2779-3075(-)